MIHNSAAFINTRLQPGGKTRANGEPFQRLGSGVKTVETVSGIFRQLHPAEAGC